jgi:NAD(P)-dependent dehydrogenase (short-subunit alcohol dehydrogenase family)
MPSTPHWTLAQAQAQAQDQTGRLAVVTGANVGLGFETARALVGKGASLVLACRNAHKAAQAKAELLKEFPRAIIECASLDTSSLTSVRAFAAQFLAQHQRCDLLINNAGIMMTPYEKTADGFEGQLATNYLGHFLLTSLLLPTITRTPGARIVTLSSLAHNWSPIQFDDMQFEQRYSRKLAYGQSKTACLMFALELQRRLSAAGNATLSMAAHPGFSNTQLGRNLPFPLNKLGPLLAPLLSQSAAAGALPSLYAALGDDLKGGSYTGPSGKGETKGPPRMVGCNEWAKDPVAGARLWTLSETMTGASWSFA